MRSSEKRITSLWLSCLLIVVIGGLAWADGSGEITGVRLEPDKKRLVIEANGKIGQHVARVMGQPNRIVMDFKGMAPGKTPGKIKGGHENIEEIRVGGSNSQARVVVDFQTHPVPPFHVRRDGNAVLVIFGDTTAKAATSVGSEATGTAAGSGATSHLDPSFVPAAGASAIPQPKLPVVPGLSSGNPQSATVTRAAPLAAPQHRLPVAPQAPEPVAAKQASQATPANGARPVTSLTPPGTVQPLTAKKADQAKAGGDWAVGAEQSSTGSAQIGGPPGSPQRVAQGGLDMPGSPGQGRPARDIPSPPPTGAPIPGPGSGGGGEGSRMVREVRPPVTPPTPDPRLLTQEITELSFVQVGHNARLIVRGGDHLDYRLNKVSPTKVRIDLINAEIPKVHQKPLRTDQFSTSVEMIVPGSQQVFIQLKDAVPYQVEKQKGVLMIDFPPPRFAMTPDQKGTVKPGDDSARQQYQQSREARSQAMRIMREEEILKANDLRRKAMEGMQKQQEELNRQRSEIMKRYRITPDPDVFSKPVTMDFQGISLKNAFRLLAEQAGINIILDDDVKGSVTMRLVQIPLGQVVDTILNTHNLDREMVGNVMRIGKRDEIKKLKETRLKEYEKRMEEVDKRLAEIRKDVQKKQEENEKALKDLEKVDTKAEEATEDVKSEEVGEAGCIKLKGEDVCFYYTRVKVIYGDPEKIVATVRCLMNLDCKGSVYDQDNSKFGVGADAGAQAAQAGVKAFEQEQVKQGFLPGTPALAGQMMQAEQTAARQVQAGAIAAGQQQLSTSGQSGGGVRAVPVGAGMDPDTKILISNTMMVADKDFNYIFLKDTPERIEMIKKLIASLDLPLPQVVVESRLVEATRGWARGIGVMWGGRNNQTGPLKDNRTAFWGIGGVQNSTNAANTPTGATVDGTNIPSTFAVNLPAALAQGATTVGMGIQFGLLATQHITELDLRLQLGEQNSSLKTIGRPKVQVQDNKTATIKRGFRIPYIVTGPNGVQTQFLEANLELAITPKIYPDGKINMKLKTTNNEPGPSVAAGPTIIIREADTIMMVKDGETAVIGGIIQQLTDNNSAGWPGLMNIPVIGNLFSTKNQQRSVNELLIFITPTILKRPPSAS